MKIWVDADACPVAAKEILFRAAERTGVSLTLVANQPLRIPPSKHINMLQVPAGFDVADNEIVRLAEQDDLVITSDIPLAAEVIAKGALVLTTRGERYTKDNIGARLNMRDFMDTMRASGIHEGGSPAYGNADKQKFANHIDRILSQISK